MKLHPVAELFPMLPAPELKELADNIRANGLQHPIIIQDETLLDGRNRLAACEAAGVKPRFEQYKGDSPVSFIIASNLLRRHLNKGQKIALAIEIEPFFAAEAKKKQGGRTDLMGKSPIKSPPSRDRAATSVGLSGKTVSAAKAIKEKSPEIFKEIIAGKKTVSAAKKELKANDYKKALTKAQQSLTAARMKSLTSVCDLRACSCHDLFASGIKPDAVITDPPYPKEFLPVFSELAIACKSTSVPLVAVMSGQSHLPEVLRRLCEHLSYRWTIAYMTPGGQAVQQWQAKVNTTWKPVLLFGEAREWFGDVAASKPNDNDKRFHDWGQSESGMADLVDRLTKPGQLVCDPFCGAGTTAVVCLALGRRFIGCDIDPASIQQAKLRIEGTP